MPWNITQTHPDCDGWAVVKTSDNTLAGCHPTETDAKTQLAALYANERSPMSSRNQDLYRSAPELRVDTDGNTLSGYAAVFNSPTEINSWEGHFTETIQPGAFKRTLKQQADKIKVLFNHGADPVIGEKPLGKPKIMREDDHGLYVEVPLDNTSYNRDLKASLASGAIDGMSFRFQVVDDQWDDTISPPARQISEVKLMEFGPVTFPAYSDSTAKLRSLDPRMVESLRSQLHPETRDVTVDDKGNVTISPDPIVADTTVSVEDSPPDAPDLNPDSPPPAPVETPDDDPPAEIQRARDLADRIDERMQLILRRKDSYV